MIPEIIMTFQIIKQVITISVKSQITLIIVKLKLELDMEFSIMQNLMLLQEQKLDNINPEELICTLRLVIHWFHIPGQIIKVMLLACLTRVHLVLNGEKTL